MKKIVNFLFFAYFLYANELNEILKTDVIRIGINENTPPFSKLDSNGQLVGFEIEVAKEIVKNLSSNMQIDFIHIDKSDRISALEDNRVDLIISALSVNKERNMRIDFSTPYFFVNTAILTKRVESVDSINSLKGKKIAIIQNTTTHKDFKDDDYSLIFCKDPEDCFLKLQKNEADAFVTDDLILFTYEIKNSEYEVAIKRVGKTDFIAIGVSKNSPKLLEEINKILIKISKNGSFKKVYNETIAPIYEGKVDSANFLLDDIYGGLI